MGDRYYSTSSAFLEALAEAGIRYMFANFGSDHPGLIEALAQARAEERRAELPELIVCPHETIALSAAHAYAAVSGQPQAVLVHVDSGTQNLGGAVNNAARGRVPVLIFAGSAPYTIEGELPGSRNEFIHWIQDVHDQRGILRNYTRYPEVTAGIATASGSAPRPERTVRGAPRAAADQGAAPLKTQIHFRLPFTP